MLDSRAIDRAADVQSDYSGCAAVGRSVLGRRVSRSTPLVPPPVRAELEDVVGTSVHLAQAIRQRPSTATTATTTAATAEGVADPAAASEPRTCNTTTGLLAATVRQQWTEQSAGEHLNPRMCMMIFLCLCDFTPQLFIDTFVRGLACVSIRGVCLNSFRGLDRLPRSDHLHSRANAIGRAAEEADDVVVADAAAATATTVHIAREHDGNDRQWKGTDIHSLCE